MTGKITPEEFFSATRTDDFLIIYKVCTTGLRPAKDRIIAIAAKICLRDSKGEFAEADEAQWFINPEQPLDDTVKRLTGLTDEFLTDRPKEAEVMREVIPYFQTFPVCGFNNNGFDDIFMSEAFARAGACFSPERSFDTHVIAPQIISPSDIADYRLSTLAEFLEAKPGNEKGAMADAAKILHIFNVERKICWWLQQGYH